MTKRKRSDETRNERTSILSSHSQVAMYYILMIGLRLSRYNLQKLIIFILLCRNQQYVSKRKVYEDMSELNRFVFDWTNILEEIGKFGESKVTFFLMFLICSPNNNNCYSYKSLRSTFAWLVTHLIIH